MYANGVVPPLTGVLEITRDDDDHLLSPVLSGVGKLWFTVILIIEM